MKSPASRSTLALLVVGFAILLVPFAAGPAASADGGVRAYGPFVDLRPGTEPSGGSRSVALSLAKNEPVGYQLRVPGPLTGVEVHAPALHGPLGATIPAAAITVYRERSYDVTVPSDAEGARGEWPDALIPQRDPLYRERRRAFPVGIEPGAALAVWVDVHAGADQLPGDYTGAVRVVADGFATTVSVHATVEPVGIPSTSSLRSAFFVSSRQICAAFGGCVGDQKWAYDALFAEAALDNRLTLANAYAGGDPKDAAFGRYFLPLVEGSAPHVDLPGAKLTSVEVWGPSCGHCLGPWRKAAERDGFARRFFLYACDEPYLPSDWAACHANVARGRRTWPGVRALVTASFEPSASWVDVYATLINEFDPVLSGVPFAPRAAAEFAPWLEAGPGRELWLYSSCRSYSCSEAESAETAGRPGYAIDEPPFEAAAMSWLAYLYGATGELYYSTTESLATAASDQYTFGGNGDGNLFYAGTPDGGPGSIAVGGRRPIPIESIRLKWIREGRQDYEYLRLAEARGARAAALAIVEGLLGPPAGAGHRANVDAARAEAARAELRALVSGAS